MKTSYLGSATEKKSRRRAVLFAVIGVVCLSASFFVFSFDHAVSGRINALVSRVRNSDIMPELSLFRVTSVTIEGNQYLLKDDVLSAAAIPDGENLLGIKPKVIEKNLLSYSRIEYAKVRRIPPGTVKIFLRERKPVLLVRAGKPYEIDSSGVALSPLPGPVMADLPIVSGIAPGKIVYGRRLENEQIRLALRLMREIAKPEVGLTDAVSEIRFSSSGTIFLYTTGSCVMAVLTSEDIRSDKLVGLKLVLNDLKKKSIQAESIDLRFTNQFVVRTKADGGLLPGSTGLALAEKQ